MSRKLVRQLEKEMRLAEIVLREAKQAKESGDFESGVISGLQIALHFANKEKK